MELISKKELLEITGISYSALYRWKRKRLIPEEWFIHRATYTGQETFFPRDKILPRIARILELKENLTLDDLAETFTENTSASCADSDAELFISPEALELLRTAGWGGAETIDTFGLAQASVIERMLESGEASREEAVLALRTIWKAGENAKGASVYLYRKLGVPFCIVGGELTADDGAKLVFTVNMSDLSHEAAVRLKGAR